MTYSTTTELFSAAFIRHHGLISLKMAAQSKGESNIARLAANVLAAGASATLD